MQAQYEEGMSLFDSGLYSDAYEIFKELHASGMDTADMEKKASDEAGKQAEQSDDYIEAVKWYKISGNDDALMEARYQYVVNHLDRDDETTDEYLAFLVPADYKDSKALRDNLYAWEYSFDVIVDNKGGQGGGIFNFRIYKAYNGRPGDKKVLKLKYTDTGYRNLDGSYDSMTVTLESSDDPLDLPFSEFENGSYRYYDNYWIGHNAGSCAAFDLVVTDADTGDIVYEKHLTQSEW